MVVPEEVGPEHPKMPPSWNRPAPPRPQPVGHRGGPWGRVCGQSRLDAPCWGRCSAFAGVAAVVVGAWLCQGRPV